MPLSPGTRLGPYEITGPLGAGGMGEVYRAKDTRLDRTVAIKVLAPALAADAEFRDRFEREARTISALNHQNVCTLYDVAPDYLVMELVEGESLDEVIARSGRLPVADALRIARQIADALEAAHERGIVHRDLKPANVRVTPSGQVKVLDFGLAKAMDVTSQMNSPTMASPRTAAGLIMGTAAYMSPEQARGLPVDRRADVWAFGCVLYELLTGIRPFQADDTSMTLARLLKDDVSWDALPADVPPAVRRMLRRCLEKNPQKRLDSMHDVALQIEDVLAGSDSANVTAPPGDAPPRRRRLLVTAVAACAALAVGVTAGVLGRDAWLPGAARVTEVTYQPLTFDTGFVFSARFGPDGRTVVYSADWEGQARDLFMTSVDSREARPLGFAGADLLALAPSGEMAVLLDSVMPAGNLYVRMGSLARSSMTGGRTRAELANVEFADIAPDGTLAIIRQGQTEMTLEFPAGQVIARRPRAGNSWITTGFVTARVSPDGKHVAVLSSTGSAGWRTQIFRRGGALVMEDPIVMADWWGLAWRSANEVWIAGTEAGGQQTRIFALSLEGTRRLVFRAPGSLTLHDISRQGDVLSSFDHGDRTLELIAPDGQSRALSWQDGGLAAGIADNGLVLVNQNGDGGGPNGSAIVWPKGAAQPVRIAEGTADAVSPDGSTALVSRADDTLTIVPTGTGQSHAIDVGPVKRLGWTGWHPDGRVVLDIVRPDDVRRTYAVPTSGGPPVPFLPPGFSLEGGRLISPDGRGIIATGLDAQLHRCSVPAMACVPLPGRRAGDEIAGWLADNRTVIVLNDRALPGSVDALDVESGRRAAWRKIVPQHPSLSGVRKMIVAPDGSMLLGYDRTRGSLYVIRGLR